MDPRIVRPIDSRIINSLLARPDSQLLPDSLHTWLSFLAGSCWVAAKTRREVVATMATKNNRIKVFLNITVAFDNRTKLFWNCYRKTKYSLNCVNYPAKWGKWGMKYIAIYRSWSNKRPIFIFPIFGLTKTMLHEWEICPTYCWWIRRNQKLRAF